MVTAPPSARSLRRRIQAEGNFTSSIIFCVRTAKEKKKKVKKSEMRVTCFWADGPADGPIYPCENCKGCL